MSYARDKLAEKLENLETIYQMISDLRDYVDETEYLEKEYILEMLQDIQQYAK